MIDWVNAFGILMQNTERNELTKASCINAFCITIQKLGFDYKSKKELEHAYNFFALFYSDSIDCRIKLDA
jgi:hypothetical protein